MRRQSENCIICGLTSEFTGGLNPKRECENCEASSDLTDEDEVDLSIVKEGYDWTRLASRSRRDHQEV